VELRSPCSRVHTSCSQHGQDRLGAGALPLSPLIDFRLQLLFPHEKRTQTQSWYLSKPVSQSLL
jgi:hypothetical protein